MLDKLIKNKKVVNLIKNKTLWLFLIIAFVLVLQVFYTDAKYNSEVLVGKITLKEVLSLIVHNQNELNDAINFVKNNNYQNATIVFGNDITLSNNSNISIAGTNNLTIDMSGYTLSGSNNNNNGVISIGNNVNLNINNGTITNRNTRGGYGIAYTGTAGNNAILNSVSVEGYTGGLRSSGTGEIIINNSTVKGDTYGVNNASRGTITINNSTITGTSYAVYNNSRGTVNITGGDIYNSRTDLWIIIQYPTIYNGNNSTINISGGTFHNTASNNPTLLRNNGTYNISGGSFQVRPNENYIVNGYTIVQNTSTNYYDVVPGGGRRLAQINQINVLNYEELINAISSGQGNIILGNDITLIDNLELLKGNINLNGFNLITSEYTVLINNNEQVIISNGLISGTNDIIIIDGDSSNVVLEGIRISSSNGSSLVNKGNGTIDISNCEFKFSKYGIDNLGYGLVNINSGMFLKQDANNEESKCINNVNGKIVATGGRYQDDSINGYFDEGTYELNNVDGMYVIEEISKKGLEDESNLNLSEEVLEEEIENEEEIVNEKIEAEVEENLNVIKDEENSSEIIEEKLEEKVEENLEDTTIIEDTENEIVEDSNVVNEEEII